MARSLSFPPSLSQHARAGSRFSVFFHGRPFARWPCGPRFLPPPCSAKRSLISRRFSLSLRNVISLLPSCSCRTCADYLDFPFSSPPRSEYPLLCAVLSSDVLLLLPPPLRGFRGWTSANNTLLPPEILAFFFRTRFPRGFLLPQLFRLFLWFFLCPLAGSSNSTNSHPLFFLTLPVIQGRCGRGPCLPRLCLASVLPFSSLGDLLPRLLRVGFFCFSLLSNPLFSALTLRLASRASRPHELVPLFCIRCSFHRL